MVLKNIGYIKNLVNSLSYQLIEEKELKQSQLVGCYGIDSGSSVNEIVRDFKYVSALKGSRVKNRFVHIVMSHPKEEEVTDSKAVMIANDAIKELGFDGCQFTMTRHIDFDDDNREEGRHYHITISRVKPDGELVDDSFLGLRLHLINEKLEERYNLKVRKKDRSNSVRREMKKFVQQVWDKSSYETLTELKNGLSHHGYRSYLTQHGENKYLTVCERSSPIKFSYKLSEFKFDRSQKLDVKQLKQRNNEL